MSKKIKIITSFDDGSQYDLQLGDLLKEYNIPAIFYISPNTTELFPDQIRKMAGYGKCESCKKYRGLFKIGAHTLNHPENLSRLTEEEITKEVAGSKSWIEQLIKNNYKVDYFAYPSGRYNEKVKEIVKIAGFKEARTTRPLNIDFSKDPFETHPTIHIHPDKEYYQGKSWLEWADKLFAQVLEKGGRFELWGHSWEIEEYNMWEFLEDFLAYMDEQMKKINYPRLVDIPFHQIKR